MKKNALILTLGGALALAAGAAQAVEETKPETELNNTLDTAQGVFEGGVVIDGFVGGEGGDNDVDFFAFKFKPGAVVTVDIDEGMGGEQSVNLNIAIYEDGRSTTARFNDNNCNVYNEDYTWCLESKTEEEPTEEDPLMKDPFIDSYVVPEDGKFTVGVSSGLRYLLDDGMVRAAEFESGDYQLIVSAELQKTLTSVDSGPMLTRIEVKPGSDGVAPVNPKSRGVIPVAIFGSGETDSEAAFEVANIVVDPEKLRFGATGDEKSLVRCEPRGSDLNGDYYLDRVCHFDSQLAGFEADDAEGHLKGWVTTVVEDENGNNVQKEIEFEAVGYLKVIPAVVTH